MRARQRGARTNESRAVPQRVLRISAAALPADPHLLLHRRDLQSALLKEPTKLWDNLSVT
jgi:hypothetical protein